jgi:hypothetical protein
MPTKADHYGATPTDTPVEVDAQNLPSSSLLSPVEGRQPCECGELWDGACASCAVADWQAAHPECSACCPVNILKGDKVNGNDTDLQDDEFAGMRAVRF